MVVTGLATMVLLAAPDLVLIGLVFLIVPGLVMSVIPTVFLYQCLVLGPWLVLRRRRGDFTALAVGLAIGLGVGVGGPQLLNAAMERAGSVAMEGDQKLATKPGPVERVWIDEAKKGCGTLCQLLLLNGVAREVIVGEGVAYRLEESEECVPAKELERVLDEGLPYRKYEEKRWREVGAWMRYEMAGPRCLVRRTVKEPTGEMMVSWVTGEKGKFRPVVEGIAVKMASGEKGKLTQVSIARVMPVLWVEPVFAGMKVSGWRVGRGASTKGQMDGAEMFEKVTGVTLEAPQKLEADAIRDRVDAVLRHKDWPAGAFALLRDYELLLLPRQMEEEDERRVLKLVGDERVTRFGVVERVARQRGGRKLRDAVLERMADGAEMEGVVRAFPKGAFADAPRMMDEILVERDVPALVERLPERGPEAVKTVVRMMEQVWAKPPERSEDRRKLESLQRALCAAGTNREALEAMEKITRDNAQHGVVKSLRWKAMLVALGGEVETSDPRERKRLEAEAKRCGKW